MRPLVPPLGVGTRSTAEQRNSQKAQRRATSATSRTQVFPAGPCHISFLCQRLGHRLPSAHSVAQQADYFFSEAAALQPVRAAQQPY
jgi:hypothetical protein